MSILVKNGQILATNGQILVISEFSRHIEYNFLEEKHIRTTFIPKIGRLHSRIQKLQAKNFPKCQFWSKMANFWPQMAKFWPFQNFPSIQSMILSKNIIGTTSIPKISKIYSSVWKLQVKNSQNCQFWPKMAKFWPQMGKFWPSQNFPRIQSTIFSKNIIGTTSIPKISKIYSSVWKLQVKNS